ncbi:HIT family protein [Aureibacillus halotolerans]|uniref:Histidine triad (HIT) family protein n=1 Tax=Aureibacillus halotolerans TaxID=1508390 RepID=A0A4R6TR31_9BACI|nr:HIT family protein [Aureibacillus halotolerans]TDQ35441.1 histidine triad (HIT) family protein [Aureibacillus halotolerans]
MNNSCIFCSVTKGDIPSNTIMENDWTKSFLDIRPINPGHTLVIPKMHVNSIHDLNEENYLRLMESVRQISSILHEKFTPRKVGIAIAGFDIEHLHIHVVPMYRYHDITSEKYLTGTILEADPNSLKEIEEFIKSE